MTGIGVRVERLHCPLCEWTHDRESPPQATHTFPPGQSPLHDGNPANLQEAIADVALATLLHDAQQAESVIRAHLETHTLEQWVAEVARLRGADAKLETVTRQRDDWRRAWLADVGGDGEPPILQVVHVVRHEGPTSEVFAGPFTPDAAHEWIEANRTDAWTMCQVATLERPVEDVRADTELAEQLQREEQAEAEA